MKLFSILALLILNITCFSQTISYVPVSIQANTKDRTTELTRESHKTIYSESRKEAIKKVNDFCLSDSVICTHPIAIENRGNFYKAEIIYRIRKQLKIIR